LGGTIKTGGVMAPRGWRMSKNRMEGGKKSLKPLGGGGSPDKGRKGGIPRGGNLQGGKPHLRSKKNRSPLLTKKTNAV